MLVVHVLSEPVVIQVRVTRSNTSCESGWIPRQPARSRDEGDAKRVKLSVISEADNPMEVDSLVRVAPV